MTETYTAPTNGHEIRSTSDGGLRINKPGMDYYAGYEPQTLVMGRVQSLREYFRDERDRELGRWRSPADPIFVGYKTRTGKVKLVNEVTGDHEFYSRRQAGQFPQSEFDAIAEEYFDAHPEKKPWHDAKPGEVWELTTTHIPNKVTAWSTFEGVFMDGGQNWVTGMDILDGHRIWPESKES